MEQQQRFKIKSIVYEAIKDDGTVQDFHLVDSIDKLGYIKFLRANNDPDCEQQFWIASSHDGLTNGLNVIASPVDKKSVTAEMLERDRTNTMIGLIKDGACTAYVCYTADPLAIVK